MNALLNTNGGDDVGTEWIRNKRENWPSGSLERQLMLESSKSLVEAVQKRIGKANAIVSVQKDDYEQMKQIIEDLKGVIGAFDIDKLDPVKRKYLASMPLTTIKEALAWKAEWEKVINEAVNDGLPARHFDDGYF